MDEFYVNTCPFLLNEDPGLTVRTSCIIHLSITAAMIARTDSFIANI